MNGRDTSNAVPLEDFIKSITSQLDRAQTALAFKARAGLPLTFAVRDLSLDLRTHVEVDGTSVRIRPAGSGDTEASTLHIALTTITRPLMEENTFQLAADPDEISIDEVAGDDLSKDDLRRLEWAGIHTVSQLKNLNQDAVERVANVPAMRLRAALQRAALPMVHDVEVEPRGGQPSDTPPLVRLRGLNLRGDRPPLVRMNNEEVPILESRKRELVLAPLAHQMGGEFVIEGEAGEQVRVNVPHNGASGSGLSASGSRLPAPGSGLQASGSGLQASGSGLQASGSGLPAPGSGLQAPGNGQGSEGGSR